MCARAILIVFSTASAPVVTKIAFFGVGGVLFYLFYGLVNRFTRLRIFRALVGAGPEGMNPGALGVLLAFAIPYSRTEDDAASPSHRLEEALHKPVAFLILPVFSVHARSIPGGDSPALIGLALFVGLGHGSGSRRAWGAKPAGRAGAGMDRE